MPVYPDTNLIYTFHFYDPFVFTHQGASWASPSLVPLSGVPFPYNSAAMPPCPDTLKGTWIEGKNQIPATSGNAFDFGTLIIAPVSNLLFENVKYNLDPNSYIKPKFDLSLGYSILNMGKKVVYVDQAQADPIPRTARLGYTLNFGIDLQINQINLNAFNYSFSGEAEDILINSDEMGFHGYQGMLGDINFGKHLIALKADQNVVVHKGHIFRLFETVIITSGRYNGGGFNNYKSNGFGFSSEGIFKLLSRSIENNVIGFIANHFVLEYYDTNNFADSGFETNFQGLAFYFKNFGL